MASKTFRRFSRAGLAVVILALGPLITAAAAQAQPMASFTVSPSTSIYAGDTVTFDASGSVAQPTATYAWDFGNGTVIGPLPGEAGMREWATYAQPGHYTVTLTVADSTGTATASQTITVSYQSPDAALLFNGDVPSMLGTVTPGTMLTFSDASSDANPGAYLGSFTWDFGDGTAGRGDSASHTYAQPGTYTVTETVTDSYGMSGQASYQIVVAYLPIAASFLVDGYSPDSLYPPAPGDQVSFTDASSDPNPGAAVSSVIWNFGDGTTAAGPAVAHAYAQAGTYTVTETVADNHGLGAQASGQLVIDAPPTLSFSAPSRFIAGQAVTFNASASRAAGAGLLVDYSWDFGDDNYDSGPVVTHTYTKAGRYQVWLQVTDAAGLSSDRTVNITVQRTLAGKDARADFTYQLAHLSRFGHAWRNSRTPKANPSPVCPQALINSSPGGRASCTAEFAYKGVWYVVSGTVSPRQDENAASSPTPTSTATIDYSRNWKRAWRRSSKGCAARTPGRLSSNDRSCYAPLIRQFFHYGGRYTFHFKKHVYILGTGTGYWPQWNTLSCSWKNSTYQCTNSFGDGFRWMPYAR